MRVRHHAWLVVALTTLLLAAACSGPDNQDPTAPPLASAIAPTATLALASPTLVPATSTHQPSPTATPTPEPTATATPQPTATPTIPPTATPTPTLEPTAKPSPTATPTVAEEPVGNVITVSQGDTGQLVVALTFDAGADRGNAAQILDTLRDEGVVATFGMTGVWAADNPDLVARMVAEGHVLMNHTWDHRSWTGYSTGEAPLTAAERADELRRTEEAVSDAAGVDLRPYFRPPYGDTDDTVAADLQANGYSVVVMWTVDTLGWAGRDIDEITRRVLDGAAPGAIYLMHVGAESRDAAALPGIIEELRAEGYDFVTIAQLVGR